MHIKCVEECSKDFVGLQDCKGFAQVRQNLEYVAPGS